ncbi:MAG: alpha/beta hydrolase [Burkholderiaceae bacterium]|nr:alpha/beta hydrolase [Burkholderiaceae bacterium]
MKVHMTNNFGDTATSAASMNQLGPIDGGALISLPDPVAVAGINGQPKATSGTTNKTNSGASCRTYKFPVRLDPQSDETIEVSGELATRRPLGEDTTIQVLLAGGSNNGAYWDWPLEPEVYSYVRHATIEGFATLNLDRPGYGKSDHPDPTKLDFSVQGYVVQQVIEYLKEGALGHKFKRVVLNGHSMGGAVAWRAASGYSGVDAVIVSGVGHNIADSAMQAVHGALEPIETHPGYGLGTGWAPGYFIRRLTPDLPKSAAEWYTAMLQDTVMIAELKAIVSDSKDYSITRNINVPILFALGQRDLRWCTSTLDCATDPAFLLEPDYYKPDADFSAFIVPNAGHLTNKDPGARFFFERVTTWLRERGF